MERKKQVRETARQIIENGDRPSAALLAQKLEWPLHDIHRCLNALEKDGEVSTYTEELMKDKKMRMVGLQR
ncbi:MAG: hypothetical protein ABEK04_02425 [Candidatus Nanohalobium sp.]